MGEKPASGTRVGLGLEFRFVFSALAAISLVLGYVGLRQLTAGEASPPGVLDLLYWDLQLFVLGSSPLDAGRDLPLTLEVARFSAPAATAYALFTTAHALMRSQIETVRARRSRGHTVVCGSEATVMFLARRLVDEGRQVVMIDPSRVPGSADWAPPAGVLVVAGDPRDREVLRRAGAQRAREVMACTSDGAFNAEVVLAMDELEPVSPVACYAEVDDRELCAAMVARTLSSGRPSRHTVEFFSRHDRAARRLADRASFDPLGKAVPAVLVIGTGPLARALVVELARRWHRVSGDAPPPLPVCVLGPGADAGSLAARLPLPDGALTLDVRPIDPAGVDDAEQLSAPTGGGQAEPTHVFVCLDGDTSSIRLGLVAADLLDEARTQIVVAVSQGTVFGRLLGIEGDERAKTGTSGPILHNVTDAVYSPEAVRQGMIEDIARSAHETYVAAGRARGETPQSNPSLAPWDELPERLRELNRAQAADIGNKLASIGCVAVPTTVGDPPFAFEPDELERLSQMEHARWLRAMRDDGWTYGPDREPERKRHPDLVAWDELTEEARHKDRSAVRAIPDQLRAAGFSIVRRPAGHSPRSIAPVVSSYRKRTDNSSSSVRESS